MLLISAKWFSLRAAIYAIASLFLVLQLVLAVQKYLDKPSMTSPAAKPCARQGGLVEFLVKRSNTASFDSTQYTEIGP